METIVEQVTTEATPVIEETVNTAVQVAPVQPKMGAGKKAGIVLLVTTAIAAGAYGCKKLYDRHARNKARDAANECGYDNVDIAKRDNLDAVPEEESDFEGDLRHCKD